MNKNHTQEANIIIIGAGISGSLTAIALAKYGINCTLIERACFDKINYNDDGRTTSLTFNSVEFLTQLGIWPELEAYSSKIEDIYVFDNSSSSHVHFSSKNIGGDALGYMAENSKLRELLHKYVKEFPEISLRDNTSYRDIYLKENSTEIALNNGEFLECDLAIVAEGKNSRLKEEFFSSFYTNDYNERAIICNITHERSHNNKAIEHFTSTGVLAFLPLKEQNKSAVVWSLKADLAEHLYKNSQVLCSQLNYWAREYLGSISIDSTPQSYPLTAQMMRSFVRSRLLLIADAAHNIHPLAGQGINQGIKDVSSLAYSLNFSKTAGLEYVTETMLQEYNSSRFTDNLAILGITDNLGDIFAGKSYLLKSCRRAFMDIVNNFPKLKTSMVEFARGKR